MKEDISLAFKLYSVVVVLIYIAVSMFLICGIYTVIATEFDWSLDNPVCQIIIIALNNWFK